jgi:adenine phosphoribosyltransferase
MSLQTNAKSELSLPLPQQKTDWLKKKIRDIPDFPKPGILFKDVTTLLRDPEAFVFVVDVMAEKCRLLKPDAIAGIEARGFIFAAAIAYRLGLGFVPVRKPGKLPHKTQKVTYDLEYGTDSVEVHIDAVASGQRVVLIDDLLATGGTAVAAASLFKLLGAEVVGIGFLVELSFLPGRQKLETPALKSTEIFSLISF